MIHSGDTLTDEGEGDDETIRIELDNVPKNVVELYITVNIYTEGITFNDVFDSYVRITVPKNTNDRFEAG